MLYLSKQAKLEQCWRANQEENNKHRKILLKIMKKYQNKNNNFFSGLCTNRYFKPFLFSVLITGVMLFVSRYIEAPTSSEVPIQAVKSDLVILECDLYDAREKRRLIVKKGYSLENRENKSSEYENNRYAKKSQALENVSVTKQNYKQKILLQIIKNKYYPFQAQRMQLEDEILVRFTINKNGDLIGEVVVSKESRYPILNAAGIKTIKLSAPFPPFPKKIKVKKRTFTVPVTYALGG